MTTSPTDRKVTTMTTRHDSITAQNLEEIQERADALLDSLLRLTTENTIAPEALRYKARHYAETIRSLNDWAYNEAYPATSEA